MNASVGSGNCVLKKHVRYRTLLYLFRGISKRIFPFCMGIQPFLIKIPDMGHEI